MLSAVFIETRRHGLLCGDTKLWFMSDDQDPVTLGHHELDRDEVIVSATRDGHERPMPRTECQQFIEFPEYLPFRVTSGLSFPTRAEICF